MSDNTKKPFADETRDLERNQIPLEVAKLLGHIAKLDPQKMAFAVLAFGHENATEKDTLDVVQMAVGEPNNVLRAMQKMAERVLANNPELIMPFVLNVMSMVSKLRPDNVAILKADARTPEGERLLREHGLDALAALDERSPEEIVNDVLRGIADGTITKH